MKDRFDDKLFQLAEKEKLVVPETVNGRVDDILKSLPKQKRMHRMNFRKAVLLAAVLTLLCSFTVTASVGIMRARMEAMNQEKLEQFFAQIYTSKNPADNYNRYMTDSEKERKEKLQEAYEEQGLFPEGEIYLIEESSDYKGKKVAYLPNTGTFFLPEQEMSDEELLQIIDFVYKRDYSLKKINQMIADGEMELESILDNEEAQDPGQELAIPYEGELSITAVGAGKNNIYLGGFNAVHKMPIGGSESEIFFDGFEKETQVACIYEDVKGNVYIAGAKMEADVDSDKIPGSMPPRTMMIWKLDAEGRLLQKIDLSAYASEYGGWVSRMAVDEQGYIYLMGLYGERLFVLNEDGSLLSEIEAGDYSFHRMGGLGVGKDGKVYTLIYRGLGSTDESEMGIASIDLENGCLKDIYSKIVPKETVMLDVIAPGAETDFVFWGYDGVFIYDLGEETATNILPSYEAPCDYEGALYCALPDGRILIVSSTEYKQEEYGEGESRYMRVPEKTYFYYLSGIKKK